jgi:hypothetical protein
MLRYRQLSSQQKNPPARDVKWEELGQVFPKLATTQQQNNVLEATPSVGTRTDPRRIRRGIGEQIRNQLLLLIIEWWRQVVNHRLNPGPPA